MCLTQKNEFQGIIDEIDGVTKETSLETAFAILEKAQKMPGKSEKNADTTVLEESVCSLVYKIRTKLIRSKKELSYSKEELLAFANQLPPLEGWETVDQILRKD